MITLTDFLYARLDERRDLALLARNAHGRDRPPWVSHSDQVWSADFSSPDRCRAYPNGCDDILVADAENPDGNFAVAEFIAQHDPTRVLVEIEAMRRIVDCLALGPLTHPEDAHAHGGEAALVWACCVLARMDSDHPDFNPAWER